MEMPNAEIKNARKIRRERYVRQGCSKNRAIRGANAKNSDSPCNIFRKSDIVA